MLYRYLPKSAGLRRITLHKSISTGDKMYLLLCECSNFLENLSAAALLLPALRARLCGYTGLYRTTASFWMFVFIHTYACHREEWKTFTFEENGPGTKFPETSIKNKNQYIYIKLILRSINDDGPSKTVENEETESLIVMIQS